MNTTTTATTTDVRDGLARLLEWLTQNPAIPLASIGYVDDTDAELELPAGGLPTLAAAADVADALVDATIEVTDNTVKRITELSITGTIPGDSRSRPGLSAQVITGVYDDVRARLLTSLGAPTDHTGLVWDVTAGHLRGLVERAATTAGA